MEPAIQMCNESLILRKKITVHAGVQSEMFRPPFPKHTHIHRSWSGRWLAVNSVRLINKKERGRQRKTVQQK